MTMTFTFRRIWNSNQKLHCIPLILCLLLTAQTITFGQSDYPLRDAVEFTQRDGLPNFFQKLEAGGEVTIAYLGGSITAQQGWRVQSLKWFQGKYPTAKIEQIPAAIGGTGSDLGVFRIEKDALSKKPDLLFVEFAVNDSGAPPERITKAMEGIVRKTWKANPETDICFVYTVTYRESEQLANGKMKRSASVMESVADHYGIPSIHMGYQVALLEKAGKLVMKTKAPMTRVSGDELDEAAEFAQDEEGRIIFSKDGVHPYLESGHLLYTQALIRSMEKMQEKTGTVKHRLSAPIDANNWEPANQYPINSESNIMGTQMLLSETDGAPEEKYGRRQPPYYRLEPGASLHFKFTGTKVMIYDLIGPDGALLEITVDDESREQIRMDGYCTYHRVSTLKVADDLENTVHEVSIRVLDKAVDKSEVLFGKNRADLENNPVKYQAHYWYPRAIFVVGELIPES